MMWLKLCSAVRLPLVAYPHASIHIIARVFHFARNHPFGLIAPGQLAMFIVALSLVTLGRKLKTVLPLIQFPYNFPFKRPFEKDRTPKKAIKQVFCFLSGCPIFRFDLKSWQMEMH